MLHNEEFFDSHDGTKLFLYRWTPESEPKAVIHIAHGMAEHALRYKRLVEKLTSFGIEVWAADQRGHGRTAGNKNNKPSAGGLLGHCANGKSYAIVTKDIHEINKKIKKTLPNVPLFLMGHSWGSFIAQNYIEEYCQRTENIEQGAESGNTGKSEQTRIIKGCLLSGTKGPGDVMVQIGKPFLTLLAFFIGQKRGSKLAQSMADGQYNKQFAPNRTKFDWLSRDNAEVDKYIEDPLCGFLCSVGFYRDLTRLLCKIHNEKEMAKIDQCLPLYIFSGNADPVGGNGESVTALVTAYRKLGIKDIEFALYPGARHETLNETNREEVTDNLITWINKHCEL